MLHTSVYHQTLPATPPRAALHCVRWLPPSSRLPWCGAGNFNMPIFSNSWCLTKLEALAVTFGGNSCGTSAFMCVAMCGMWCICCWVDWRNDIVFDAIDRLPEQTVCAPSRSNRHPITQQPTQAGIYGCVRQVSQRCNLCTGGRAVSACYRVFPAACRDPAGVCTAHYLVCALGVGSWDDNCSGVSSSLDRGEGGGGLRAREGGGQLGSTTRPLGCACGISTRQG